jgi:hypothetical protein
MSFALAGHVKVRNAYVDVIGKSKVSLDNTAWLQKKVGAVVDGEDKFEGPRRAVVPSRFLGVAFVIVDIGRRFVLYKFHALALSRYLTCTQ